MMEHRILLISFFNNKKVILLQVKPIIKLFYCNNKADQSGEQLLVHHQPCKRGGEEHWRGVVEDTGGAWCSMFALVD